MNRSIEKLKVAQFGLGPIGVETLRLLADKPWAEIVGGIDIDPAKVGTTIPGTDDAKVFASFDDLAKSVRPDVVIHTAGSKAAQAIEQILPIARAGVSIVSSCEEMLFPALRAAQASRELDRVCQQSGARVVGTGVNPGFVVDVLPVCLTGVMRRVDELHMRRVVNASTRRMPLQKKIGSGMEPERFRQLFREGQAGHAGFQESASLVAHCMGWTIERLSETCEPMIADRDIRTQFFEVKRGQTCGLHQQCRAIIAGRERITMDMKMYLDAPDPHDAVQVNGDPAIDLRINGGVAGDEATIAALVNAIPRLLSASPGVKLMTDLPAPSFR